MTLSGSGDPADAGGNAIMATDARAVRFSTARGFGRGYDPVEVDQFVVHCAAALDSLTAQLTAARAEIGQLHDRLGRDGPDGAVGQAVSVLSTAQQTADGILARARQQRDRVDSEAADVMQRARMTAADVQREAERRARQVTQDATRRAAALEQQAPARAARLTATADAAQHEIDRETTHLQTVRDAGRAQLEEFVDGILDRVADQFGRANPLAAQAAIAARHRVANGARSRQAPAGRGRRGPA